MPNDTTSRILRVCLCGWKCVCVYRFLASFIRVINPQTLARYELHTGLRFIMSGSDFYYLFIVKSISNGMWQYTIYSLTFDSESLRYSTFNFRHKSILLRENRKQMPGRNLFSNNQIRMVLLSFPFEIYPKSKLDLNQHLFRYYYSKHRYHQTSFSLIAEIWFFCAAYMRQWSIRLVAKRVLKKFNYSILFSWYPYFRATM